MESIFEVKNRNRFISSMNPQERNQKYSGWKKFSYNKTGALGSGNCLTPCVCQIIIK